MNRTHFEKLACSRRVGPRRGRRSQRRGVVTLWTILAIPVFLAMFCFVLEVANIWLARAELENALESAALAAVKTWGDNNGGSTLSPRQIGVAYAAANGINSVPVTIDENYDPGGDVNENRSCLGDLIFGEVRVEDNQWVFDANERPSCGPGEVLFDATGQGTLDGGNDNEWGVAFLKTEDTPPNLLIESITFEVPPTSDYYFLLDTFGISDSGFDPTAPPKIREGGGCTQVDVLGLRKSQISLTPVALGDCPLPVAKSFRLDFSPDAVSGDAGFEPCDRFRFGVKINRVNNRCRPTAEGDGDEAGQEGVRIIVVFSLGGVLLPAAEATLVDTEYGSRGCSCYDDGSQDPCGSVTVHPALIPNLPCPAAAAPRNDGQSYVVLSGGDDGGYGVRAQATLEVQSLCGRLCGLNLPFEVNVKTTAFYSCRDRRPKLIRILPENFHCGPIP